MHAHTRTHIHTHTHTQTHTHSHTQAHNIHMRSLTRTHTLTPACRSCEPGWRRQAKPSPWTSGIMCVRHVVYACDMQEACIHLCNQRQPWLLTEPPHLILVPATCSKQTLHTSPSCQYWTHLTQTHTHTYGIHAQTILCPD